jgi:hypothetical protein
MLVYFTRLLLPHIVFFGVLAAGWWTGELTNRRILIFVGIWLVAILGLPLLPSGFLWMTAAIAVTDIVLVLMVFKRDITID